MVANGRVYNTFPDLNPNNRTHKNVPRTEEGMDDLTTRIGALAGTGPPIPEPVQEVAVAATDGYAELHLVVGSPDTDQYLALTHFPPDTAKGWRSGNVSTQVGRSGRVVASAIATLSGDLHLYSVTDDGEIWGAVRRSSNGGWTGLAPLKPVAGDVGKFTHVTVTGFDDSPEYTTLRLNTPTDLRVENVQPTSVVLTYS
jgi:hypothetical protein